MRWLVALLWIVVAAAARGDSALPALPEDQRAAWAAVGRINIAGYRDRSFCTGTLVAPARVLTAAHCVVVDGAPRRLDRMTFVAGWDRGAMLTFRRVSGLALHPAWPADPRADLAILTLDKPIAPRQLPALPPVGLGDPAGAFAVLGYHRTRPNLLNGRFDCRRTAQGRRALGLDCPVIAGNSGAPVLRRGPEGWQVVAVISARPRDPGETGAIAALVDPWVQAALGD